MILVAAPMFGIGSTAGSGELLKLPTVVTVRPDSFKPIALK